MRRYREELALHVVQEALRLHPGSISFSYNADVKHIDLDAQTVTVACAGSEPQVSPKSCCQSSVGSGWR